MDRKAFISSFAGEEPVETARLWESVVKAGEGRYICHPVFSKTPVWKKAEDLKGVFPEDSEFIGFPGSERKVFVSPSFSAPSFLVLLEIKNLYPKVPLGHRDYLGGLMSLGIEREKFSDLIIKDGNAYLITMKETGDLVLGNLEKIGRNGVKVSEMDFESLESLSPEKEEITVITASLRSDAVVASLTDSTRSSAQKLISEGKVLINGLKEDENDREIKPGDFITIRGYGKFMLSRYIGETRKGKSRTDFIKFI